MAITMLAINHVVGVIGLNTPLTQIIFEKAAAFNLVFSLVLVLAFESLLKRSFIYTCTVVFFIGMAVEIAGINTGFPFGIYHYTANLGPGPYGVPVIIGLNWILLSYTCITITEPVIKIKPLRIVAGAILMVLLDLMLEGFAIRHHLWVWGGASPPLSNYISWFVVSVFLMVLWQLTERKFNVVAAFYVLILVLFLTADTALNLC